MELLSPPTKTKAKKDHRCNFCCERISAGSTYFKSTLKHDGELHDWKTHTHCADLADRMKMYDDEPDGVSSDVFCEHIHNKHDDLLIGIFPVAERQKYSDIIQQIRHVNFHYKLWYVIRHFIKLDLEMSQRNPEQN